MRGIPRTVFRKKLRTLVNLITVVILATVAAIVGFRESVILLGLIAVLVALFTAGLAIASFWELFVSNKVYRQPFPDPIQPEKLPRVIPDK